MDLKFSIKHASDTLRNSDFNRHSHLMSLWNCVKFVEHKNQIVNSDAELSRDCQKINVYPSLARRVVTDSDRILIREFGRYIFGKSSTMMQRRWKEKMSLPSKAQITAFQEKLKSQKFKTYKALVEDFASPVDRLVAMNLANAFIRNSLPIADAHGSDVRTWGATTAYASQMRYHSLIPLVSAYCPRSIMDDFGEAFADGVISKFQNVRHSSIQGALRDLIGEIIESVR